MNCTDGPKQATSSVGSRTLELVGRANGYELLVCFGRSTFNLLKGGCVNRELDREPVAVW